MNNRTRRTNRPEVKYLSPLSRVEFRLSPVPSSVGLARGNVVRHLVGHGMAHQVEAAELIVSELVTNAVRVGAEARPDEPVIVRVGLSENGCTCIEVYDCSARRPVLRAVNPCAESGRGLLLVEALSERCGYRVLPGGGKVVWAVLG